MKRLGLMMREVTLDEQRKDSDPIVQKMEEKERN